MAAAGSLAYVLGVLPLHRIPAPVEIPWWALAIAIALTESFVVHIPIRGEAQSFSLTEMPLVIGLFFTEPAMIVPAYLLGSLFALTVVRRQSALKMTFNMALVALESSLAVIVFHAIVSPDSPLAWSGWLAAFAAALTQDLVADSAVNAALALMDGRLTIDWNLLRFGWLVYSANVTLGIAGVLIIWTQPGAAWTLLVLGAIPFIAYRSYAALNSEHVRLGMLYESTRSLLDGADLDTGADGLLSRLMEMFDAERAELVTFGHGGTRAVARRLELGGDLTTSEPWDLDLTEGVWGRMLSEREAVLLPKPMENPTLRAHFEANGVRDGMVAPVFGRNSEDVVGTVAVFNRRGDVGTFQLASLRLLETVAHQVSVSLEKSRLIEELRTEADVRRFQALHDQLTGLPNRTRLLEKLRETLAEDDDQRGGSLVLVNVDGFQHVNDTLGHEAGDQLLKKMAERLQDATDEDDFLARIGGDEFVVIRSGDSTQAWASRLLPAVSAPMPLEGIPVEVTVSAGRATWPKDATDGPRLLRYADVAMRIAKASRSGIEDYRPERDVFSQERLKLIGELRGAIAEGQLFLVYQPKVHIGTGAVEGTEALVRWRHPERGLVPPNEFIPYIEHTALIAPLTEWVINEAVRQLVIWRRAGLDLSVSVNVSARHLDVRRELERVTAGVHEVPPERLVIEITEGSVMIDVEGAMDILRTLRERGFGLSMDDFGTGFSSLSRLKDIPLTELKIDRSFVVQMVDDPNVEAIVGSTIELGQNLGLHVVAEGVETEEQWELLKKLGCDSVQGFLLSRPLPSDELEAWMAAWSADRDRASAAV